jgi:hypothetical protein
MSFTDLKRLSREELLLGIMRRFVSKEMDFISKIKEFLR